MMKKSTAVYHCTSQSAKVLGDKNRQLIRLMRAYTLIRSVDEITKGRCDERVTIQTSLIS